MIPIAGSAAAVVRRKKADHPNPCASTPAEAPSVRSGTAASEDSSAYCVALKERFTSPDR